MNSSHFKPYFAKDAYHQRLIYSKVKKKNKADILATENVFLECQPKYFYLSNRILIQYINKFLKKGKYLKNSGT